MAKYYLFTSESVSEGHPDKICDQISDAILDEALRIDKNSRVACEVFVATNFVLISGEITIDGPKPDYEKIARDIIREVGYTSDEFGFNAETCQVLIKMNTQSPDIAQKVNRGNLEEQGAGDQGIMFGYATTESEGLMPLAIVVAHKLMRVATRLRKEGKFVGSRPDMKSQVTMRYYETGEIKLDTVLMSVQHDENIDFAKFEKFIINDIMIEVAKSFKLNTDFKKIVNPGGRFVVGGPAGDTGLTGRKIIIDTYGGYAKHGGGAFSGKDPSKVDRSAAYMCRYAAKNLVAAGVAERLEIQVAYAIGRADPLSINVATFKTAHYSDEDIYSVIRKVFDFRPGAIIKNLDLKEHKTFNYRDLARYGHFGRPDLNLPWEKIDKVDEIKELLKNCKRK